jgi:hypothetical protein
MPTYAVRLRVDARSFTNVMDRLDRSIAVYTMALIDRRFERDREGQL